MVQLKPFLDNSFTCPECKAAYPFVSEIRFESINILAVCTCTSCKFEFYHTLPVGHMVDQQVSIGKVNQELYSKDQPSGWQSEALFKSYLGTQEREVVIERVIYKNHSRVVILNTLDSLYGHVLLKLYNAFYHLKQSKEIGLIVIVPKLCKWLVPQGCAEAWVVDLKLGELVYGYAAIRKFVSLQLNRFQEIHLSKAYSHPNLNAADTAQLTGVIPFDLANFSKQSPIVTFVLREDRWWFTQTADYWFYRICRKLKILSWASQLLSLRQNHLIKKVILQLRRELPDVDCYVVGLGKTGSFSGYATDERKWKVDASIETSWCNTYARSHVVVGVHGSNMLLPTALAAGCVEVLPEDRYGNMVQDLSVRYNNRLQLFFYRFVDQFSSPKSVSSKVISMLHDYAAYDKNMCQNVYTEEFLMTDFGKR